jgi:hypothetical protein
MNPTAGHIHITSGDFQLYTLDTGGGLVWSYYNHSPSGGWTSTSVAVGAEGQVYSGSYDINLYALLSNGSFLWSYEMQGYVLSPPAVGTDGNVYTADTWGLIYSLTSAGTANWVYDDTYGAVWAGPAIGKDGVLFTACTDGLIYALESDGTPLWRYKTANELLSSPAIDSSSSLILGGKDNVIYCIEDLGSPTPTPTYTPTATPTPLVELVVSNSSPSAGDRFTVDVIVQPVAGSFTPWSVIAGFPDGQIRSLNIKPPVLRTGKQPFTKREIIDGLQSSYSRRLLDVVIPRNLTGNFNIITGLTNAEVDPRGLRDTIPGYSDKETVQIK